LARALGAADLEEAHVFAARERLEHVASAPDATAQDLANVAAIDLWVKHTDPARMRDWASRALAKDANNATAEYCLGIAAEMDLDMPEAIKHFRHCVQLTDDIPAKTHLATDLQDSKDPAAANEAIALFQSIRERGMEYAGSFYSTAVYRIAHGYVT